MIQKGKRTTKEKPKRREGNRKIYDLTLQSGYVQEKRERRAETKRKKDNAETKNT